MRQVLGKRNVIPKRRFNRDIITTFTVTSETLHHKGGVFKMKTLKNYFPRLDTKQVALLGLLAALLLILSRFTFGPDWLKFGFSFIASGLIAKWYGPIWGAFVAFICDFSWGDDFDQWPALFSWFRLISDCWCLNLWILIL